MHTQMVKFLMFLAMWLLASSCGQTASTETSATDAQADASGDVTAGDVGAADVSPLHAPTCDPTLPPIVFAHGFLAAGDTWAGQMQRFVENGHCTDRLFAFDWNTLAQSEMDARVADLDAFIDGVTQTTGAKQVDLMGHSAGGGLGYAYLADPVRFQKVRKYVHVASFHNDALPGPDPVTATTPMLNVWSDGDLVIQGAGDIAGATNAKLPGLDHYAVATSEASFVAMWQFLHNGAKPAMTAIAPDDALTLRGKALTLGENTPEAGAQVTVWALDATGAHRDAKPVYTTTLGKDGTFGPLPADVGVSYAFEVKSATPDKPPITYYRPPFTRSDALVYLRTLPSPDSLAGTLLAVVPFDDQATVLIVFSASRAIVTGKDSLTADGTELATADLASAAHTAIAFFVFDADSNGQSDGTPVGLFQSFPFLSGVDHFFAPQGTQPIVVRLNGQEVRVPHQPSKTAGPVVVVFP